jgi:adenylate cyclase
MPTEIKKEIQLEIAHVLFIDIVGYSKLSINEQRTAVDELNSVVRVSEQFQKAQAAARLIKIPTGDGMALVFYTSPEAPAQCAVEVSRALKEHPRLQLRMGVHSGPVSGVIDVNGHPNLAGAGLNVAQRAMDCGDAGHILVSKHVAEDLEEYEHWRPLLHDLGECEVKHGVRASIVNLHADQVGNPQLPKKFQALKKHRARVRWAATTAALLALAAIVAGIAMFSRYRVRSTLAAPEKSIAVLPFLDLSQAKDQEYFCDGISEEILDALAKIEGLRVVARTSSFSFKEKNADVSEVANRLNVQNVLEGSLRRDGNRIRITAQLINGRDGFHLWSDTYERELHDVFALQDEITRAIVDALKIKLAISAPPRAEPNTEAYDLYLRGLYLSNKSSEVDLRKALTFFERALEKDPNFARAWTGVAKVWWWLSDAYVRPLEAYPALKAAALKAIALDEKDAEAHCYLGEGKRMLNRDLAGEETELKRALEIDPSSAIAHLCFGLLRSTQGELQQAVVEMQAAEKLDPLSPSIRNFASRMYLAIDRLEDAVAEAERTVQLDPSYLYLEATLATAYREKGDFAEAIKLYEKTQEAAQVPSSGLAITYARMGRQDDARRILRQLIDRARVQYVAAESIAAVYVALGENDEAFRWLERAFSEHSESLDIFVFHREFRPLRSDPRFANLLRGIGVDPAIALARQNKP